MIERQSVLKNVRKAIFEALTVACCVEFDTNEAVYYLHGDSETGDLYVDSGEQTPENVILTAIYRGETGEDYAWESEDNKDFMNMIGDMADAYMEKYGNWKCD